MKEKDIDLLEQILKKLGKIELTLDAIYKIQKQTIFKSNNNNSNKKCEFSKDIQYEWENEMPYDELMKKLAHLKIHKENQ